MKNNTKRTTAESARQQFAESYVYHTLGEWKSYIEKSIAQYGKDAKLQFEIDHGYYDGDESIKSYIIWQREETDEEFNARMKKVQKADEAKRLNDAKKKKQKEENERAEYKRLRAKYGE